jgi:hypothetical protein
MYEHASTDIEIGKSQCLLLSSNYDTVALVPPRHEFQSLFKLSLFLEFLGHVVLEVPLLEVEKWRIGIVVNHI